MSSKFDKLSAAQLRKAVTDQGENPMDKKFGKGNPKKLREFLEACEKQAAKAANPAAKEKAKPVIAESKSEKPKEEKAVTQPTPTTQQWQETVNLRLAALENALGLSHANKAPAQTALPPDYTTLLADYLQEVDGSMQLVLDAETVGKLTGNQLDACASLLGITFMADAEIRVKRQTVVEALHALDSAESVPTAKPATAARKPEKAAPAARKPDVALPATQGLYAIGDVVRINWPEEEGGEPTIYEPCQIRQIKKNNVVIAYFPQTNELGECTLDMIVGKSDLPMPAAE